jgi:hypothetical protein
MNLRYTIVAQHGGYVLSIWEPGMHPNADPKQTPNYYWKQNHACQTPEQAKALLKDILEGCRMAAKKEALSPANYSMSM